MTKIPIPLKIDQMQAKMTNFSTIIVNLDVKKAIIAAGPKQAKGPFPKNLLELGILVLKLTLTHYYKQLI